MVDPMIKVKYPDGHIKTWEYIGGRLCFHTPEYVLPRPSIHTQMSDVREVVLFNPGVEILKDDGER